MMERSHRETLILGVGNPLRRDDGIGPAVIQLLEKERVGNELSDDIDLFDGGTDGLGLIEYLKEYKKVVIIDAVEMKKPPGTVKIFTPEEATISINTDSLSTHGFGIAELIKLAKALDIDTELIIVGVQPEDINYGEELSESVKSVMSSVVQHVLENVQHPRRDANDSGKRPGLRSR